MPEVTEEKPKLSREEALRILEEHQRRARKEVKPGPDNYQVRLLLKYPRVVAHLICQSLGYFSPRSAANAVQFFKDGRPFFCEWYYHMAQWGEEKTVEERLLRVGRETLRNAIKNRHTHRGMMADYPHGRVVIVQELNGNGPELASWF